MIPQGGGRRQGPPTPLAALLLGAVDVVLELNADLPLVGLVPDVGVLQQLLRGRPLGVVLHQAALDEAEELLGPVGKTHKEIYTVYARVVWPPPHFVWDRWGPRTLADRTDSWWDFTCSWFEALPSTKR